MGYKTFTCPVCGQNYEDEDDPDCEVRWYCIKNSRGLMTEDHRLEVSGDVELTIHNTPTKYLVEKGDVTYKFNVN